MNCRRIVKQIEKRSFGKTTRPERIEIKFHLSYCRSCRDYEKISELMDRVIAKSISLTEHKELTPTDKNEMIKSLSNYQ